MNTALLARALRANSNAIRDIERGIVPDDRLPTPEEAVACRQLRDASELVRVLAYMLEGKTMERAFGAPGDWGYGTPIGDALAAAPAVQAG